MGRRTLELRHLIKDSRFDVFSFDYEFYVDDDRIKREFEDLFVGFYYFHEINSESVARWKHMLEWKLKSRMNYYKELYDTVVQAKQYNFMLNKDLTETTTRTVDVDSANSTTSSSTNDSQHDSKTGYQESSLFDGVSEVQLTSGYLTNVNSTEQQQNSQSQTNSISDSSTKDKTLEQIVYESKGNIGVTSTASLLTEWRQTIVDLNLQLVEEMRDLFLIIY